MSPDVPVLAGEAAPGWYSTPRGRLVELLAESSKRWRYPPQEGHRPYRIPADTEAGQVEVLGWLPPEYPLRPASPPASAQEEAAVAEARAAAATARLAEAAPRAREASRRAAIGRLPEVGTVLRRDCRDGRTVEATVVEGGVEFGGEVYASLSAATTAAAAALGRKYTAPRNFWNCSRDVQGALPRGQAPVRGPSGADEDTGRRRRGPARPRDARSPGGDPGSVRPRRRDVRGDRQGAARVGRGGRARVQVGRQAGDVRADPLVRSRSGLRSGGSSSDENNRQGRVR